jgi:hypothetical protein
MLHLRFRSLLLEGGNNIVNMREEQPGSGIYLLDQIDRTVGQHLVTMVLLLKNPIAALPGEQPERTD